eukprot:TRINITY_DN391_c0_g1_i5.p1 TRINITY_DN391_c0_g1~~TRINITY_DN391_c0_g1_i5.p1  ORF type:complete len:818 (+),score=134.41 TRINITY_DN391_c0_g1_i5:52-2505(+)
MVPILLLRPHFLLLLVYCLLRSSHSVRAVTCTSVSYASSEPQLIVELISGTSDCVVIDTSTSPSPWTLTAGYPAFIRNTLLQLDGNGVTLQHSAGFVRFNAAWSITFTNITWQFTGTNSRLFVSEATATVTFNWCNFYDHHSMSTPSVFDGVTTAPSTLYFNDCVFKNNYGESAPIDNSLPMYFTRCSFIDNYGNGANSIRNTPPVFITNCFFTNSNVNNLYEVISVTSAVSIIQSTFYQVEGCIVSGYALSITQSTFYHPLGASGCIGAPIKGSIYLEILSSIISTTSSADEILGTSDSSDTTDGLNILTGSVTAVGLTTSQVGIQVPKANLLLDCTTTSQTQPYCILSGCSPAVNRGTNSYNLNTYPPTTDIANNPRLSAFMPSTTSPTGQDILDTGSYELQFPPPSMTAGGPYYVLPSSVTALSNLLSLSSSISCASNFNLSLSVVASTGTLSFSVSGTPYVVLSSVIDIESTIAELNIAFSSVQYSSSTVDGSIDFSITTTNGVGTATANIIVVSVSPSTSFTPTLTPSSSVSSTITLSNSITPTSAVSPSSTAFDAPSRSTSVTTTSSISITQTPTASTSVTISTSQTAESSPNTTTTKTPTATPQSSIPDEVQCSQAKDCLNQVVDDLESKGMDPCEDITKSCGDDTDCFESSRAGATSSCEPAADYSVKLTRSSAKEDQQITILSTKGVALAKVLIKGGAFEAGVTISIRWIPSPKSTPEVETSSDCGGNEDKTRMSDAEYGSSGVVEITAKDKNGNKVTKLDNKIAVTLPTLKRNSKSCIGYQQRKDRPFKCDSEDPKVGVCLVCLSLS